MTTIGVVDLLASVVVLSHALSCAAKAVAPAELLMRVSAGRTANVAREALYEKWGRADDEIKARSQRVARRMTEAVWAVIYFYVGIRLAWLA